MLIFSAICLLQKAIGSSDYRSGSALAEETVQPAGIYDQAVAVSSGRCDEVTKSQHISESDHILCKPDYRHSMYFSDQHHPDSSKSDQDQLTAVRSSRSRSSSRYFFFTH